MKRKIIKFTDKVENKEMELLIGSIGQHIYRLTNKVSETNDAIRWCNSHKVGDTFDCEIYSMTIKEIEL